MIATRYVAVWFTLVILAPSSLGFSHSRYCCQLTPSLYERDGSILPMKMESAGGDDANSRRNNKLAAVSVMYGWKKIEKASGEIATGEDVNQQQVRM